MKIQTIENRMPELIGVKCGRILSELPTTS